MTDFAEIEQVLWNDAVEKDGDFFYLLKHWEFLI